MKLPNYSNNGDGRAYIYHRSIPNKSRRLWLGEHGSPESIAEYERFIRRLRESEQDATIPTHRYMTVLEIACKYFEHAETYYRSNPNEFRSVRDAVAGFVRHFAEVNGDEIGPKSLLEYQESLVQRKLARTTINQMVGRVKRMFKWASSHEYVPPETHYRLTCVEGLRKGRSKAKEPRKILPVPISDFQALLPFLSPPVRAMAQIQFLCGMRPGEVCIMRGMDIDRNWPIWLYRPASHKGSWRENENELAKAIPKTAQAILKPFLRKDAAEYLFRPVDGKAWSRIDEEAHSRPARTTPVYPSELRSKAAKKAQRAAKPSRLRPHYSTGSYGQAISYAFETAFKQGVEIPQWSPNQLRHAIATEIRKTLGQQQAQLWLGHQHLSTTGIYAEKQVSELIGVAEKLDAMWADSGAFAVSPPSTSVPTDCTKP